MSDSRLIVLKFGGSVLRHESDLACAVHEIYRWRRDGWQVVAIVSALHGHTDELLKDYAAFVDDPSPCALAAHVANGEIHSAALLGRHLDRAGIPAMILHPAAVQLHAEGTPLDAQAVSIDRKAVRRALDTAGVVVLPGFVAIDEYARTVVLGRGGSDLSALFVAHRLGADHCRLIKDVDGLYERDPRLPGPAPRRYEHATWDDALATDGSIVQHKAVKFARDMEFPFELATFNACQVTRIGSSVTKLTPLSLKRTLRVALLGLGTVGAGVWRHLHNRRGRFEVSSIAVRHVNNRRAVAAPRSILTDDALQAAMSGADVVIELIGGMTIARECVEAAIDCGSHVVTANKALVAEHGVRLRHEAAQRGVKLLYSAAVGGSMPINEFALQVSDPAVQLRAVLNGTCNFVLERIAEGASFESAIADARERGYCELDHSRDVDGLDAADKLCVLAHSMGFEDIAPHHVDCEVITPSHVERAQALARSGGALRQVATLEQVDGSVQVRIALVELQRDDPLFDIPGAWNRAVIYRASGVVETISGRGAGRWPTAEAVLADVLAIERDLPMWRDSAQVLEHQVVVNNCSSPASSVSSVAILPQQFARH